MAKNGKKYFPRSIFIMRVMTTTIPYKIPIITAAVGMGKRNAFTKKAPSIPRDAHLAVVIAGDGIVSPPRGAGPGAYPRSSLRRWRTPLIVRGV